MQLKHSPDFHGTTENILCQLTFFFSLFDFHQIYSKCSINELQVLALLCSNERFIIFVYGFFFQIS